MSDLLVAPITSKGQVTIPKTVRQALHIQGSDIVGFRLHRGHAEIVAVEIKARSPYTKREWKKIEEMANEPGGRIFSSANAAKRFAKSL